MESRGGAEPSENPRALLEPARTYRRYRSQLAFEGFFPR